MTSIFTADTSTQGTGGTTNVKTFNTKDNANMRLFSKSGIYNSADNEIKIFTNNIDALTIDANQKVICDGSLITNLTYTNITGRPTLATVATSGLYNDLSGKPTLATVATSGLYNDLLSKPDVFTKNETSNNFTTLTQSNNLYQLIGGGGSLNLTNYFTKTESSNIFVASNVLSNINLNSGFINCNITNNQLIQSLNSYDYKYNGNSLFNFAPANTPTYTNGTQTTINANTYYIQFLANGTLTIPANMTCDALIVGAGGRGGLNSYAGGGGAGEVIYYPSFTFLPGIYNVQVGADSTTIANRDSKIYIGSTDYLKATGGGNGASYTTSLSVARRYPPKAYNTLSALTQPTFNGQASFKRDITLDTTGITYGSGVYETWCSSRFNTTTPLEADKLFNWVNNATTQQFATATAQYSTTSPFGYIGTRYLVESTYKGDWAVIKMVVPVAITSYSLYQIVSATSLTGAAKSFKIYASNDGTTWTTLQTITGATYTSYVYTNTALSANTTPYYYYAIVVNQLVGNNGFLWLNEWEITGKEFSVVYSPSASGGSGGGGSSGAGNFHLTNQAQAVAGVPFSPSFSKLNAGNASYSAGGFYFGGNGGSAGASGGVYDTSITGALTSYGAGGIGAGASSTPTTKTLYGSGGDGNGGLASQGIIILRFSATYLTKFNEYTNWYKLFNINVGDGLRIDEANNNKLSSFWSIYNNNLFNNNTGKVGVGINNPLEKFHIGFDSRFILGNDYDHMQFTHDGYVASINIAGADSYFSLRMDYPPDFTNYGSIAYYDIISILGDGSGFVGIQNTAPTQALDVNGTIKSTALITGAITGTSLGLGGAIIGATTINASSTITAPTFSGNLINGGSISGNSLSLNGAIIGVSTINASGTITAPTFSGTLSSGGNMSATSLTLAGTLSGVSTLTATNTNTIVNFTCDNWHNSSDGWHRLYCSTSGITYFGTATSYTWRNSSDVDIATMTSTGEFSCGFISVSATNTDWVCVQFNSVMGASYSNTRIKIAYGTFTGFHRCFIEDDLFDINDYENFKREFVGRVVVSKGKIKTHIKDDDIYKEWTALLDKDGITIEDALPIVELSRKRKDKRIYGVIGCNKRANSANDRIIINGLGEGGIWIVNTNGNLENGDLLQTSNELGYAERADDDLIRNYTVGKIVMDCTFELNCPYYKCEVIDAQKDLRRAFVACVYMCS